MKTDMTALSAGLAAELMRSPSLAPDELQLGDLELLVSGAFAPLNGFMTDADAAAVARDGRLCDGTLFPFPVTLNVPAGAVPPGAGALVLEDPEGAPLAIMEITERTQAEPQSVVRLAGPVRALRAPEHGPFRALRQGPADTRATLGRPGAGDGAGNPRPVLACLTRGPLHRRELGQLRHLAGGMQARLLLLPLVAGPAELVTGPEALVRAVLAALAQLPPDTVAVPIPLAPRGREGSRAELLARAFIAAAFGATHLFAPTLEPAALVGATTKEMGSLDAVGAGLPGSPIPVVMPGEWAFDLTAEVWRPVTRIEQSARQEALSPLELAALLQQGGEIPEWFTPPAVARELRAARPPRYERGLVIFFTGLSGSGKSTVARDLADALAERGDRTVSLLDGDQVRRLLSAGLSFSRADRDLNIARIGFVATEVARHHGIAICAPIAPYATARSQVRAMVEQTGDFLLVYVATPLEACEARDRKGLYAKARAGTITEFTGISDPYEEPHDADLVIDTSVLSRHDAVSAVMDLLSSGGWLTPRQGDVHDTA